MIHNTVASASERSCVCVHQQHRRRHAQLKKYTHTRNMPPCPLYPSWVRNAVHCMAVHTHMCLLSWLLSSASCIVRVTADVCVVPSLLLSLSLAPATQGAQSDSLFMPRHCATAFGRFRGALVAKTVSIPGSGPLRKPFSYSISKHQRTSTYTHTKTTLCRQRRVGLSLHAHP